MLWFVQIMAHLFSGESSKTAFSSKDTSFGGYQNELGSQRRGNEATSGKNAKVRGCLRETS